ncbi:tetratricopeptide repeat protein [Undibacterium sp. CY18W]|uniref:Tetratricopeptide repeat protein n=1 Tax=Undibacterium hunanense TaxID=2762292 RepID=A0ABR6ZU82_9BURK|nr:tetratricopeptide repeat protein [Undibacterium hunanense]MBC3919095.1 tetratricopeptide repeat protein [Undibacterium hunanense]
MNPDTDTDTITPAEALFYQANDLMAQGQADAAEAAFRQALLLEPDLAEAHANLAWLLAQQGRYVQAEPAYQQALHLAPDNLHIALNFAVMLAAQKRLAEAEQQYRQILAQDADHVPALSNLGVLLASMQRDDEAEACYRQALVLAPDYRKAAFNLAYLLLRQGRYDEGWHMLEARDGLEMLQNLLQDHLPAVPSVQRWLGQDLGGKSIIILFESGHGDMMQFARYASLLKRRGAARVSCLCHPALKRLFTLLDGLDDVWAFDQDIAINDWDCWVAPLSLPGLFGTRVDHIPADLPYLHAHQEDLDQHADIISMAGCDVRVGLVWHGNLQFENDADRSIHDLQVLQPLTAIAGVHFFSLQKGAGELRAGDGPTVTMPLKLSNLAPRIHDFADTAAIIMQLDLVLTVDTAVAHLAGALGKPCWVMLPAWQPDWRWLTQRDDSPWYPGVVRLFRQGTVGDWAGVIQQVCAQLALLVAGSGKT